jgi:hypothetical protein
VKRNLILVIVLAGLAGCSSTQITQAQSASKDGWWIRVNTQKTEASSIALEFGTDSSNRQPGSVWRTGDPIEFAVPPQYQQVSQLYVLATANPQGKTASLCMMYRQRGVKHLEFDKSEDQTESQGNTDGACAEFVR